MNVSLALYQRDVKAEFDYNQTLVDIVSEFGTWNDKYKFWSLPFVALNDLISKLKEKEIPYTIDKALLAKMGIVDGVNIDDKEHYRNEHIEYESINRDNHDSNAHDDPNFDEKRLNLSGTLLPYQRAGISYIEKRGGRCILGDDMGLGKTIQGIGVIQLYKNDLPAIVIAPSSLLLNWRKEIIKWANDIEENEVFAITKSYRTKNKKKVLIKPKGKITIVSYDYARKHYETIIEYLGMRGILIVDESHNLKGKEAKRTESIVKIAHHSKRCILLSGTPILNRPKELFSQLRAIDPIYWSDYWKYAIRYCDAKRTRWGMVDDGQSNTEELYSILREHYMVRRLKNDVLTQMPPKIRNTVTLALDNAKKREAEKEELSLLNAIEQAIKEEGNKFSFSRVKRKIMADKSLDLKEQALISYKKAGEAKKKSVSQYVIEEIKNTNNKIILFGHHKEFLDEIEKNAQASSIKYIRIDGSSSKEDRFNATETFQSDEEVKLAILSISAASVGLTLTKSSRVIMGEIPWTPGLARQAEDRAHRIGQKDSVLISYIIAENTIDGSLWEMLNRKSTMASQILDDGFGDEMDEELIEDDETGNLLDSLILQKAKEMGKKIRKRIKPKQD